MGLLETNLYLFCNVRYDDTRLETEYIKQIILFSLLGWQINSFFLICSSLETCTKILNLTI